MSKVRNWWIGIVGGVALAAAVGGGAVMAQTSGPATPVPSATVQQGQQGTSNGQFKSNEDPTHEAAESAQQEAAENSGQAFHGGNCPHGQGSQGQGSQTPGTTQTPTS